MKRIPLNFGWSRTERNPLPWEKDDNAARIDLPDDFVHTLPRKPDAPGGARVGYMSDGYGRYAKVFDLPAEYQGKRIILNMDGAYMNTVVKFNGDTAALHPYGYTPTVADLTKLARFDIPNELVITAHGNQPSSRWYSGAGIYREVELWIGEPCYLDPRDLFVTTPVVGKDRAAVQVSADVTNAAGAEKKVTVTAALSMKGESVGSASGVLTVPAGEKGSCVLTIDVAEPLLWDDIEPNLYDLTVSVEAEGQQPDLTEKKIGIRRIEISAAEGLKVNGRKLKLYGGCVHHDNGILGARAFPRAEERKLENLKAAGFNAIRTAHNPPSEALLDACDRLGIFVIDEFFDCWRTGKNQNDYSLWFEDWWKRDIAATILRDRNHPSVYCWSFGNEIREALGLSSDGPYWMKVQADYIRTLDDTRLVTCGGMFVPAPIGLRRPGSGPPPMRSGFASGEEQVARWKEMLDCLDIISLNYSFHEYELFHDLLPDKVIQGTETQGIEAWNNREAVRKCDWVIGDFMWTAHDNLGEAGAGRNYYDPAERGHGLMAGWPWLSCYQGDLALDGERLPRSYYRKVIWGKDDGIHLFTRHPEHTGKELLGTGFHWHDVWPVWSWSEEWIGKPVDVEAYADCDEVEFFVNGVSAAKAVPVEMIASAAVDYAPGELKAVAYKDGRVVAETVLETVGKPVRVVLEADRPVIAADGMDLCYVTATVVDEKGRRVYDADCELTAAVSGAGTLAGFGSNDPCTEENYGTGRRRTWNGRATVIIRAGKEAGAVELAVTGGGYPAALLQIETR